MSLVRSPQPRPCFETFRNLSQRISAKNRATIPTKLLQALVAAGSSQGRRDVLSFPAAAARGGVGPADARGVLGPFRRGEQCRRAAGSAGRAVKSGRRAQAGGNGARKHGGHCDDPLTGCARGPEGRRFFLDPPSSSFCSDAAIHDARAPQAAIPDQASNVSGIKRRPSDSLLADSTRACGRGKRDIARRKNNGRDMIKAVTLDTTKRRMGISR